MRKLGEHIAMVHVKDVRSTKQGRGPVTVGDGIVDWPAIAAAVEEIGYDGYLTLEVAGTSETADEVALRSRDALRRFGL